MDYFFDESGNWQEIDNEKKRLVIAGMVIKDEVVTKDLEQDLKLFKIRNKLFQIHASEIKDSLLKEELYQIIYEYIKLDEVLILAYIINPKILFSQTMKDPDEIYIDIASDLIGSMTFGDKKIDIEYDMKFHYAYPQNIIENIKIEKKFDEYMQMSRNFFLKDHFFRKHKERISKNILRNRNRIDNINEVVKKIDDIKFVNKYLWEEFRLKTEKTALAKEKFKDKIQNYVKQQCKIFGLLAYDMELDIQYKGKHNQSAGVQVIDVVNNLLWRNGTNPNNNSSSAVKGIYKNITIKEILDGEI